MTHLPKRPTGVPGLDGLTFGGLPRGSVTLVTGAPGSGKTVLGLQIVANVTGDGEPAVFVSFEESRAHILANAGSFTWGAALAAREHAHVLDARPHAGAVAAGSFDVEGLLAVLEGLVTGVANPWIVLDGIDQLLAYEPDVRTALAQVRRLNEWSEARGATTVMSAKEDGAGGAGEYLRAVEFLLPTVLALSATLVDRRLNRRFRVLKYRGSRHVTDEVPMLLSDEGIVLPFRLLGDVVAPSTSSERIGSGIRRLDEALGGGVHRGSTVLISGAPGTSKTTLGAAFAVAAAERGERALLVTFDELASAVVRNVASVGIDIQPHIDAGRLTVHARTAWQSLVEVHVMELVRLVDEHRPDVLVIDPISALMKSSSAENAYLSTERVLSLTRGRGITTVLTSLTAGDDPSLEATLSHASTLADTWITLEYSVRQGERNRALSVVKSRGTAHTNQVRELVLTDAGIDLVDVYRYGTEVLMGTARVQMERERADQGALARRERERRRLEVEDHLATTRRRLDDLHREEARLRARLADETDETDEAETRGEEADDHEAAIRAHRERGQAPGRDDHDRGDE